MRRAKTADSFLLAPFEPGLPTADTVAEFQALIHAYYGEHARSFPWRETCDPYHILLSEMMLQQTQTSRVLEKYGQFLCSYPTLEALSRASLTDILTLWKGLGYNRRALALHRIARIAVDEYEGTLPRGQKELLSLPMVGPATSAALLAFAYGEPSLYLETNIRRVLLYYFFSGMTDVHDREVYLVLEAVLDQKDVRCWYYALMDYGVYLKGRVENPNKRSKHYALQSPFENSNRQIRSELLTILTFSGSKSLEELEASLSFETQRVQKALYGLVKDGLVMKTGEDPQSYAICSNEDRT